MKQAIKTNKKTKKDVLPIPMELPYMGMTFVHNVHYNRNGISFEVKMTTIGGLRKIVEYLEEGK